MSNLKITSAISAITNLALNIAENEKKYLADNAYKRGFFVTTGLVATRITSLTNGQTSYHTATRGKNCSQRKIRAL